VRATALLLAPFLFLSAGPTSAKGGRPAPDPLVVHEWGTFTSMQGSDGVVLEGLQHEEERLPSFVYSRTEVRECPLREVGWKGLEVPATHVTQKMETPVLYFHSKTPRRLRVRVDFVGGLLTQWFPVSDLLGPAECAPEDGPLDLSKVERSFLQWDVDVLPSAGGPPAEMPRVSEDDPWSFARDVDAAYVRTVPRKAPERRGPTEAERYIFYRGLGTFSLPIEVEARPGGKAVLRNRGDLPLPTAISMVVREKDARFEVHSALGPGETDVSLGEPPYDDKERVLEKARLVTAEILEKQGIFPDEARAMVRTWSRAWFSSEGTRILYVVPRATTDRILPLRIDPAPDEVVRVLVGRLEYLTPEAEAEVERALRDRASSDAAARDAATARLVRLDRFLEPAARRILAKTADPAVRRGAQDVLASLAPRDAR
jgi:hypothetical protein